VAVAGSYPRDIVDLFVRFLEDGGIGVAGASSAGIISGAGVGEVDADRTVELVRSADVPDADAVLVPDTAWNTIALLDRLTEAVGKPVLTANQVTVWQGLALAGYHGARAGLGVLSSA
jgi:maleate cis-trans isomerase